MTKNARILGETFLDIVKNYNKFIKETEKKYSLYSGQITVVFFLKENNNITQKQAAEALGVSKATIGISLKRLEKAGFVDRIVDNEDARCMRVSLNKKGLTLLDKCKKDFDALFKNMFGETDDKEFKIIAKYLDKMLLGINSVRKKKIKLNKKTAL